MSILSVMSFTEQASRDSTIQCQQFHEVVHIWPFQMLLIFTRIAQKHIHLVSFFTHQPWKCLVVWKHVINLYCLPFRDPGMPHVESHSSWNTQQSYIQQHLYRWPGDTRHRDIHWQPCYCPRSSVIFWLSTRMLDKRKFKDYVYGRC